MLEYDKKLEMWLPRRKTMLERAKYPLIGLGLTVAVYGSYLTYYALDRYFDNIAKQGAREPIKWSAPGEREAVIPPPPEERPEWVRPIQWDRKVK